MDYKEKYENGVECIQEILSGADLIRISTLRKRLQPFFPELQENKDDRIRNGLIKAVSGILKGNTLYGTDVTREEALAWLEKQGEQKPTLPKWKYKKDNIPLLKDSLILNKYGCVAKSPSGAIVSDVWVLDYDELAKLPKEELEKQGQESKKVSIWKHWKNGIAGNVDGKQIYLTKKDNIYSISSCLSFECDYIELSELDNLMLEKQGKEEYALKSFRDKDVHKFMQYIEKQAKAYEFNLPNRSYDIYAFAKDILHWLENQCEQKTKPKFKVRDWIVDDVGYYWRVTKVLPNYYELEGDDGVESMPTIKWTDEKFHLWTIDDAKKGDILVVDGISIVEFDKHMTDGCPWKKNSILTSVEYDMDDDICTTGSHIFYDDIWPASREDIDLFKKKRNEYLASNSHNESKFKVGDKV